MIEISMKQIVQNYRSGELRLEDVPVPRLQRSGLLVANCFSLVSAGTERMKVEQASMNLLEKARARPDQVAKVLQSVRQQGLIETTRKVFDRLDSLTPLGYSSAGIVLAAGAEAGEFQVGDRVACAGAGYANHAEVVYVPRNLAVKIPAGVSMPHAAFTTVGAIALQGLRQADVRVGDTVAVIGLGLVGQLTVQLLKAAGCRVIGIDIDARRLETARAGGANMALLRRDASIEALRGFTQGRGVDTAIITAATSSNDPIELAATICRDRGRIVVVGAVQVGIPNTLKSHFYERELELLMARSYGPGRYDPTYEEQGVDYPIGYVRWTEKRNMEAFLDLLVEQRLNLDLLITHRERFVNAEAAYGLLTGEQASEVIGLLLDYGEPDTERLVAQPHLLPPPAAPRRNQVGLSLIGAGNHARAKLIPPLAVNRFIQWRGIATASGLTARDAARKYGLAFVANDPHAILQDPHTDCVLITTRHNTHSSLTATALLAGKAVFVEKPLALDIAQLQTVTEALQTSDKRLMVGFNRRFAPHARQAHRHFAGRTAPLMMIYRVNAGYQAPTNWYQDPQQGGGRIIGEGGHFIDLMAFLCGAAPQRVVARAISDPSLPTPDNVSIIVDFADGSIGTLIYTSSGDLSYPKERLEIFGQGRIAVLDDFRNLTLIADGKRREISDRVQQDKGHTAQMHALVEALRGEQPWPVDVGEQLATTLATILALQSLREGVVFDIDPAAAYAHLAAE
jgi:predicted dehydrogenase/threonine dehydrogenase-like Zn-dependent dehydrogenase